MMKGGILILTGENVYPFPYLLLLILYDQKEQKKKEDIEYLPIF